MPEPEPRTAIKINIRTPVRKRLAHAAIEEERPQQDIADEALDEWLTRHNY